MAARNTPPPRKPGTKAAPPTRKEINTKKAGKLGYDSIAAMKSVQKFYGSKQSNVTPSIKQLESTLASQGWGVGQTAATPVMIGGMRWLTGAGKLTFTGERSDAAKRNPGKAWSGNGAGSGGVGGEMPPPGAAPGDGGLFTTGVSGATGKFVTEAGGKGPAGEMPEPGKATKTKKSKAKTKKLVKRTVKKTNVKGKAVRRALKSPGITKSDKKTYSRVAKQAPKLSSRLRVADRAAAKKGKR